MIDIDEYTKEDMAKSFIWTTEPLEQHTVALERVYRVMEGAFKAVGDEGYPQDQVDENKRLLAYFADAIIGIRNVRSAILIEGQRLIETEFKEDKH
ncbi:MAG: hypothetical protein B6D73_15200 [gamma proteobacterium symbiont of Stewartia floridana]|nr:MAG: hypothetical protein B6D73_15200 [gamma proteobacterium symbiont of Stewartia floridana]